MMNIKSIELKSKSIDDIRIFMIELVDYYNTYNNTNIPLPMFPISINKRLTRTLGRFNFSVLLDNSIKPNYIQFSEIITHEKDEIFIEAVKHEVSHYIATMQYQENCEHDYRWQEVCRILGMNNISPYAKTSKTIHRYLVVCENDGIVATRDKLTNNFKTNVEYSCIQCRRCGNDKLMIYDTKNKCFIVGGTLEGEIKALSFIK